MHVRQAIAAVLLGLTLAPIAGAQRPRLSAAVRQYVSVDTTVVALTHARVIDGTGARARADQTLILRDGRIAEYREVANVGPAFVEIGFQPERVAKILAKEGAHLRQRPEWARHLA